jgi:hypothetical protein
VAFLFEQYQQLTSLLPTETDDEEDDTVKKAVKKRKNKKDE